MHTAMKLLNSTRKINNFKEGCFVLILNVSLFQYTFKSTKKGANRNLPLSFIFWYFVYSKVAISFSRSAYSFWLIG